MKQKIFSLLLFVAMVLDFSACKCGVENGHAYVDLGLPSGTLWATCNVGATKPEDYGNYYAWGETTAKSTYNWSTYKWCERSYDSLIKYCIRSSYGSVDNKTMLELADDVANVNWGGKWRMPTLDEQKELLNNCTWEWTSLNGVNGYNVIGKNGNSIFLPASGYRENSQRGGESSDGFYWSSSLSSGSQSYACYLYFSSDINVCDGSHRCFGQSVRAVCSPR